MTFNPKLNPIFYIVVEGEFIDVQQTQFGSLMIAKL